jgi:hypothetical protein
MRIEISTPALLFPAISLLMLAYTNRFLGLSAVIRQLHHSHSQSPNIIYKREIESMRKRLRLIRDMQSWGVVSLILCTTCMFTLFRGFHGIGEALFGASIGCMLISLGLSLVEIRMSIDALDLHLLGLDKEGV